MKQLFRYIHFTFLAAILAVPSMIIAGPVKQIIDVAHSTLDFEVESFLINTEGTFKDWKGDVVLDRDKIENSSVKVIIQVESIDTRIAKRDGHLKSPDFLDTAKYPTIEFNSTEIKKTGETGFDMKGAFTMHGVTKTITIPVTIERLQDEYSRFRGQVTLSRSAFGVDYDSSLNPIKDEILVTLVVNLKNPK